MPGSNPLPLTRICPSAVFTNCVVYGSQVAQASTEPLSSATLASTGPRNTHCTSFGEIPACSSAFSATKWPIDPLPVAMRLPFKSAALFNALPGETSTAVPAGLLLSTAMALTGAPLASANSSGASPIIPASTAPALSASASGAAAGNSAHLISYGRFCRALAASSCERMPPF